MINPLTDTIDLSSSDTFSIFYNMYSWLRSSLNATVTLQ
jgi:hypothetical protein